MMKKEELYTKALDIFGCEAQTTMVFEEMSELQKELCKALRGMPVIESIAEEIADVEIMLEQMKQLYKVEHLVETTKEYKLRRLNRMIENKEGKTE